MPTPASRNKTSNMATVTISKEQYEKLMEVVSKIPAVSMWAVSVMEQRDAMEEELKKKEKELKNIYKKLSEDREDEIKQDITMSDWYETDEEECDTCGKHYDDCVSCECPNDSKCLKLCEEENGGKCPYYSYSDEEEPNKCDRCGDESYKYSTELCEALGDGYYCHDCINWIDTVAPACDGCGEREGKYKDSCELCPELGDGYYCPKCISKVE